MVERVFNKQALRTVWKLLVCFFFFVFNTKWYPDVNFDNTVEHKTVLDTAKGNPGPNGPKTK